LDDGFIAGSFSQVKEALTYLNGGDAASKGVLLNLDKCEMVFRNPEAEGMDMDAEEFAFNCGIGEDKVIMDGNFIVLGSPIGDPAYCAEVIRTQGQVNQNTIEHINKIDDPQCRYVCLKACAGICKVNHLMRTVPPSPEVSAVFIDIHNHMMDAVRLLLPGISEEELIQCQLPVKLGGLGFRNPSNYHEVAYLSSRCAAAKLDEIDAENDPTLLAIWQTIIQNTDEAVPALITNHHHQTELKMVEDNDTGNKVIDIDAIEWWTWSQHQLSLLIDYGCLHWLFTRFTVLYEDDAAQEHHARARIWCLLAPHCGAFLHARPSRFTGGKMEPAAWLTAVRIRLGMDVSSREGHQCPICNHRISKMDKKGRHALCGCFRGGDKNRRHNRLCDIIAEYVRHAGFQARREHRIPGMGDELPADVLAYFCNTTEVCDIAVTFAGKTLDEIRTMSKLKKPVTYFQDKYATHYKINKYKQKVERDGIHTFVPLVANHYGAWSEDAHEWLSKLARMVREKVNQDSHVLDQKESMALFIRLSVAIQNEQARMIAIRRSPEDYGFIAQWNAAHHRDEEV